MALRDGNVAVKRAAVRSKDKSSLSLALDHVELCCHGVASFAPYCMFTPGWLIGYDGVVAAGYRVAEDLPGVAPHTETMRPAVARAGNPYSLTVHANKLTVRGNTVKVDVPLTNPEAIPSVVPDHPRHEVSEPLREAIVAVSKVTRARHERVIVAAVLLKADSVVGTNGGTILEAHHGGRLPGRWLLPTEFALAVDSIKYKPTHIGWSDTTFTIWYGPHCWLRANVYEDAYPDTDVIYARMIADAVELRPVPTDMLLALETLKPFLDDDTITLWQGGLNTKPDGTGASYTFSHHLPPAPRQLPYLGLRFAAMYGEWIGFSREGFYWYGQQLRGISAAEVK